MITYLYVICHTYRKRSMGWTVALWLAYIAGTGLTAEQNRVGVGSHDSPQDVCKRYVHERDKISNGKFGRGKL